MFRLACAAPNCLMRTYEFTKEQSKLVKNNYTVSFHKFPRDPDQRLAWIAAANNPSWKPSINESLCSLHFGDDCFDQCNQLYDYALPTIFFNDFRSHIKNLAKAINLEVDFESGDENEDILSKSLKNIGPLITEDTDNEEQIVEITLSDDDDFNLPVSTSVSENRGSTSNGSINLAKVDNTPAPSFTSSHSFTTKVTEKKPTSATSSSNTNSAKISTDMLQKLFSVAKHDKNKLRMVMEMASCDFISQLLSIVKMANLQNDSIDSSVPNTYLITTKQENKVVNEKDVIRMETADIISFIARTIKSIKNGNYQKSEKLAIVFPSPAIFLIKNVAVKNFDPNMNCVYVVTAENLSSHLLKLNTKMENELRMKKSISSVPATDTDVHRVESTKTMASVNKHVHPSLLKTNQISKSITVPQAAVTSSSVTFKTSPSLKKISAASNPVTSSTIVSQRSYSSFNNLNSVKIDLTALKGGSAVANSLKNLNLTGTPVLVQNAASAKNNVLRLSIASPLPDSLKSSNTNANVLRLNLVTPIAVPRETVIRSDSTGTISPGQSVESNTSKRKAESESLQPIAKKPTVDLETYLQNQQRNIEALEKNILQHEREIVLVRKKIQFLKKRYLAVKNQCDTKSDEQLVEEILNKYFDQDAVQFFVSQMKVSGKTYTQFRWTEEDKLFALGLLYKHPAEYNVLFQKFTLPSDKTLSKFVSKIKKAEQDVKSKKS